MAARALIAALTPDGGGVLLRSDNVPVALWSALGRSIAPNRTERDLDGSLVVPLGSFLAGRTRLGESLKIYECEFRPDDSLLAVLGRQNQEVAEVSNAIAGTVDRQEPDVVAAALRDAGFKRELKRFQLRDLAHLLSLSHGANFSVPGAGKTTVAYALHALERAGGRVHQLLVVAPLSAFGAWEEEVEVCFTTPLTVARVQDRGSTRADVRLVNYQRLAANLDEMTRWLTVAPTHVILDEAHRMKRGHAGEWGRACLEMAPIAARRDLLTGTPAPQHPRDFVALMDFVWPNQAKKIVPAAALIPDPEPATMQAMSSRLAPLFTRTNKGELELDEPDRRVELVTMKPLQAEIYEALRTQLRYATNVGPTERAQWGRMGAVVMYLLEAASDPSLLARAVTGADGAALQWPTLDTPEDIELAVKVRDYKRFEVPAKFDKLATMVATNSAESRKTLVWSNFVDTIDSLATHLLAPFNPAVIHGSVRPTSDDADVVTRDKELRRFREDADCAVLIANPAAMSEGVSLHHECHDAIYVDRTFNAGQYLQSVDRIHRLGLEPGTETRIRFLVCRNTIDEAVDGRVRVKAERLAQMLADPGLVTMSLPDEDAYGEWVEPEDLDVLLDHLRHV